MAARESPRPLRWLTLADTPPNPDSGASGTDVQTVRALRELGHEVDDVWSDALPHRWKHGNLHYAFELPRAYRTAVRQRLAHKAYDVVLASQPHAYLAARWVRRHAPGTLFLNRSHGWEAHVEDTLAPHRERLGVPRWHFPRGLVGRPLAALLRHHCQWAADACHGIVVSASGCRDYVVESHGLDPARVVVIPQAAPASYLGTEPPAHDQRPAGSVLLVTTPSFVKGVDDALAIMQASHAEGLPLRFSWVVDARAHDLLRARLGPVWKDVLTLVAPMDQASLRSIYDQHRLFLFPSLFEGFGKAGLEAMSRGCCVVASDVGGMRDVIQRGITGYTRPAGDRQGMLRDLVEAAASPDKTAAIGAEARATARKLTWHSCTSDLVRFCTDLQAGTRRVPRTPNEPAAPHLGR